MAALERVEGGEEGVLDGVDERRRHDLRRERARSRPEHIPRVVLSVRRVAGSAGA